MPTKIQEHIGAEEARGTFIRRVLIAIAIVVGWFCSSVLVGVVNKSFFQLEGTRIPISLTSLHMLSSFVLCHVYFKSYLRDSKLPRGLWLRILGLSVVFSVSIALGNIALQYLGLPLVNMISSLTPAATFLLELMLLAPDSFQSKYTATRCFSIYLLVGGAVLSTIGDAEFVFFGFICAIVSTFLRAIKSLLQEYLLKGERIETTIYLLYLMSFPSFILLFIFGVIFEHQVLLDMWEYHIYQPKVFILVFLSSLSAFSYNIFGFLVSIQASAVAIHVLGNVKLVLCIIASIIVFGNDISLVSWIGIIMTLTGGIVFWFGKQKSH